MKKQIDPSNPVNLDSGQRKELTYIIESLKKNIYVPKKDGRGEKNSAKDRGERQESSRTGWHIETDRFSIVVDGNVLAIAETIPA